MKRLVYLLWVMILPLLMFCSCSSNDEEESSCVKTLLIGVWKTSMESSNWKTIRISPNGGLKYGYRTQEQLKNYTYDKDSNTYVYSWEENGVPYGIIYDPADNAHWAFDETTQSISMYRDDGYYAYTYKVTMNENKNSWIGIDSDGRTYTFVRIEE